MAQPVRIFNDLNLDMTVHPNSKDLVYLHGDAAIRRAVRNIVFTEVYERHYNDIFGCAVRGMLFEDISSASTINLKTTIENAIQSFEPRVNLNEVRVDPQEDKNGYVITILFTILNQTTPLTISFFLERVR
jgi:uncharacterized protein